MSNSDVESSQESLKSIDDSSDISDEEKELCSTLLSLQPYQLEPERESGSESESYRGTEGTSCISNFFYSTLVQSSIRHS